MVKDLEVIFIKGPGSLSVSKDENKHVPLWKKKSIFWDLPYWKILEVRSSIDVMHVTKNLCVNLLRSEERRVGKECRIGCRSRWSPYH